MRSYFEQNKLSLFEKLKKKNYQIIVIFYFYSKQNLVFSDNDPNAFWTLDKNSTIYIVLNVGK